MAEDPRVRPLRMPFGKQFSPNQIDLPRLLEVIEPVQGDKVALEAAIRDTFWASRDADNRDTLAMNTRLALQQYGLLDEQFRFTELGRQLLHLRGSPSKLSEELARHILLNLHGLRLVEAARFLKLKGERPTVPGVAKVLTEMGIDPGGPSGEKIDPMRLWLRRAGVFTKEEHGWAINEDRIRQLVGLTPHDVDELLELTPEQRMFLLALASVPEPGPHRASDIRKLMEQQFGIETNIKTFDAAVVEPLAGQGFIELQRATSGRGAKADLVLPAAKHEAQVVARVLRALQETTGIQEPSFFRKPLREFLNILEQSRSPAERGRALEGVAVDLVRKMGLAFRGWRRRGHETAGSEVDVIAEEVHRRFVRYQFQCKVGPVTNDHVDREVGVALREHSHAIVMVTMNRISETAVRAARNHMQRGHLSIIFFDKRDIEQIAQNPAHLAGLLRRKFDEVADIKRLPGQ